MPSAIEICNQALLFVGTRTIASMEEPTPEASYCRQFYDQAVQVVLRDHPWGFAQRREALAEALAPEGWQSEYAYAYAYPLDCLQAHYLMLGEERSQAFTLGADNERTLLFTNLPDAVLAYTAYIKDESRFDPLFTEALSRKLQCLLTKPILKGNSRAVQEAETIYARTLGDAKTADAREGRPYGEAETPWTNNPWAAERMGLFRRF